MELPSDAVTLLMNGQAIDLQPGTHVAVDREARDTIDTSADGRVTTRTKDRNPFVVIDLEIAAAVQSAAVSELRGLAENPDANASLRADNTHRVITIRNAAGANVVHGTLTEVSESRGVWRFRVADGAL